MTVVLVIQRDWRLTTICLEENVETLLLTNSTQSRNYCQT
jgi:hypothetical protein